MTANPLIQGILESAAALQMDPLWLATIISYETGGTFNPTQPGPVTRYGHHRGLIQFGEPQAMQYGVNWNDPLNSQLGAEGAVVRYFRDRGWRPGMSFMDAYSIVNAGGPGRYNASDAAAGGAPGTVADKVNNQMSGHMRNAERLLGGTFSGTTGGDLNAAISAAYGSAGGAANATDADKTADKDSDGKSADRSADKSEDQKASEKARALPASSPSFQAPVPADILAATGGLASPPQDQPPATPDSPYVQAVFNRIVPLPGRLQDPLRDGLRQTIARRLTGG
jgi:hypothetical protein